MRIENEPEDSVEFINFGIAWEQGMAREKLSKDAPN